MLIFLHSFPPLCIHFYLQPPTTPPVSCLTITLVLFLQHLTKPSKKLLGRNRDSVFNKIRVIFILI